MKKLLLLNVFLVFLYFTQGCSSNPKEKSSKEEIQKKDSVETFQVVAPSKVQLFEQDNDSMKKQLLVFAKTYLPLKEALVASNNSLAQKAANELLIAYQKIDTSWVKEEEKTLWHPHFNELKKHIEKSAKSNDLDLQRQYFTDISHHLYPLLKAYHVGNDSTHLYWQYCPMAHNNQGAYWFSDKPQIENPYFGDAMLNCGRVSETLK